MKKILISIAIVATLIGGGTFYYFNFHTDSDIKKTTENKTSQNISHSNAPAGPPPPEYSSSTVVHTAPKGIRPKSLTTTDAPATTTVDEGSLNEIDLMRLRLERIVEEQSAIYTPKVKDKSKEWEIKVLIKAMAAKKASDLSVKLYNVNAVKNETEKANLLKPYQVEYNNLFKQLHEDMEEWGAGNKEPEVEKLAKENKESIERDISSD